MSALRLMLPTVKKQNVATECCYRTLLQNGRPSLSGTTLDALTLLLEQGRCMMLQMLHALRISGMLSGTTIEARLTATPPATNRRWS